MVPRRRRTGPDLRRVPKIDLGPTAFGRWLAGRETAWGFAARLGLPIADVHRLLGHRSSLSRKNLPPGEILRIISLETGIAVATLVEDAICEEEEG